MISKLKTKKACAFKNVTKLTISKKKKVKTKLAALTILSVRDSLLRIFLKKLLKDLSFVLILKRNEQRITQHLSLKNKYNYLKNIIHVICFANSVKIIIYHYYLSLWHIYSTKLQHIIEIVQFYTL